MSPFVKLALAFACGAAIPTIAFVSTVQPRVTAESYRKGRIAAAYDIGFAGYSLYFNCLTDDCEIERRQSDAVVEAADAVLRNEGIVTEVQP